MGMGHDAIGGGGAGMKAPVFLDIGCPTTEWFDGSMQPHHIGWYEVLLTEAIAWPETPAGLRVHGVQGMLWWDGRAWLQHNVADLPHAGINTEYGDGGRVRVAHWRGRLFRALTDTERIDFMVAKRCSQFSPGAVQVNEWRQVAPGEPSRGVARIVGHIGFDTNSRYAGDSRRDFGHGQTIREAIDHASHVWSKYHP